MKLVIDRGKWLRGEGGHMSKLLRKRDGKMCCLGQFALTCGLIPKNILDVSTPQQIVGALPTAMDFLLKGEGGHLASAPLMYINDDINMIDAVRETELTKEFATHGIEVEFVDAIGGI